MCRLSGLKLTALTAVFLGTLHPWSGSLDAAGTIRINGSGSALVMMKPLITAYRKAHPELRIEMEKPLGSSGAIKALIAGALDIAVSSKPLKPEDQAQGAESREYGRTPLVVVTGKTQSKTDISSKELESAYSGKLKTWPDGEPIRLILRPETDIDTKILGGLSSGMALAIISAQSRQGMLVAITDPESDEAVIKTPGSLGTTGLTSILVNKLPVHVLTLNGIRPTLSELAKGNYPLAKDIRFMTSPRTPPEAMKFIEFIYSTKGRAIAEKSGVLVSTGGK